jgi:DNA-binding NarL/FixJ family response regulator
MIRVLIADDHAIVRAGLKQIFALVPEIRIAGEADSAEQTLEMLQRLCVDLLITDLNMPGARGVELVSQVRALHPDLPILVMTMHNEPHIATGALRAGANGYITKDGDLALLLPAIRAVAAHGHFLSPGMAEKMVFETSPTVSRAPHLKLTERETAVFEGLIQGQSISDIAAHMAISRKTVSTYKLRLQNKLHCLNVVELIRYAMRHNLMH